MEGLKLSYDLEELRLSLEQSTGFKLGAGTFWTARQNTNSNAGPPVSESSDPDLFASNPFSVPSNRPAKFIYHGIFTIVTTGTGLASDCYFFSPNSNGLMSFNDRTIEIDATDMNTNPGFYRPWVSGPITTSYIVGPGTNAGTLCNIFFTGYRFPIA